MAYDNVLPGSPEHLDRDEEAAVRCYRRAAEKDHAQAMFNLALSLRDGGGGDVEEGFDWMRRAADTGDVRAQYNAGIARDPNHKPWGVPGRDMLEKDGGEAVKFYRMAAEGGHSKAEVNLGVAL
jgi:TPR repeat protein